MEAELKIWLDYSSKEHEREPSRQEEADLLLALRQVIGDSRVHKIEAYHYISVAGFSIADLALVKKVSSELHIPVTCKIDEHLTKSDLRQVRLAPLAMEGDFVDHDMDGNPLNRFPSLLCPECSMPDESKLPATFYVSAKQMLRRRQDGVAGMPLLTKREVFWCSCGVFVATDRVKRILEVLEQSFGCTPVDATPSRELPFVCWAIRPAQVWGRRKHLVWSDPCPACGQPRRCGRNMDTGTEVIWRNRLVMHEEAFPDADLVCCETWFGDRTKRRSDSFNFNRDILLSGRLYDLLLRAKVRGLVRPQEIVAFEDLIPMSDDKTVRPWVNSKLELLKSESLV